MKTTFEEIDRRIDMPDIDAEWARFEREVIRSTSDGPSAPPVVSACPVQPPSQPWRLVSA
ncbi:MAG: hypothetical protein J6T64_08725 [Bacteroidaceae bacterium]|nr:hypothetical protein [Bacteroidaceae bacterium]